MKKIILSIFALVATVALFASDSDESLLVKVGQKAPNFEVTMFDGSKVKLSSLKGKVVLLTFWATWCPPCRAEMMVVEEEVIKRFKGQEFVFLPISRGEERLAVEKFRVKEGYTFAMGLDLDKSIYGKYAKQGIPRNFVIDKNGVIQEIKSNYNTPAFKKMLTEIEKLINNK